MDLVIESPPAVELKSEQEEWQRRHCSEHVDPQANSLGFDQTGHNNVRKEGSEEDPVEQYAPELASRFGLGDKHVHDEILLEIAVNDEVEGGHW